MQPKTNTDYVVSCRIREGNGDMDLLDIRMVSYLVLTFGYFRLAKDFKMTVLQAKIRLCYIASSRLG